MHQGSSNKSNFACKWKGEELLIFYDTKLTVLTCSNLTEHSYPDLSRLGEITAVDWLTQDTIVIAVKGGDGENRIYFLNYRDKGIKPHQSLCIKTETKEECPENKIIHLHCISDDEIVFGCMPNEFTQKHKIMQHKIGIVTLDRETNPISIKKVAIWDSEHLGLCCKIDDRAKSADSVYKSQQRYFTVFYPLW